MSDSRILFEIMVPCQYNDGTPVRTRHHKEWDKVVRKYSGGLTILPPCRGQWVSPDGTLYEERMIPVRIACTRKAMDKIMKFTMDHYKQHAVFAHVVSNEVLYMERPVVHTQL